MEIRVLRYFLTVAREGNITRAAKLLHLTQPTLSRQLMLLEEELGTALFLRGKRHIDLTESGMLLRRRAQEIIELADKTEQEFLEQNHLVGGVVSIGSGKSTASSALPSIIKQFSLDYPEVTYQLYSGNADDIKERIDKGLLDIGILIEPVNIEKYDFVRLPYKERWGVYMKNDDPLSKKEYITPNDLVGLPIMTSIRDSVQNNLRKWCGNDYDKLNITTTFNILNHPDLFIENDLGYLVSIDSINESSKNICFRPFYPEMLTGNVLVWKRNQVFSLATTKFIEYLKNAF